MTVEQLQAQCELGQQQLMAMQYLEARTTLVEAERVAWQMREWDTLARLYMPLQETRRQIRQRCGEGIVCLDLISEGASDALDPLHVVQNYSHGQILVAGWGSIAPALGVRRLAFEHGLFLETFLAAAYPTPRGTAVAIVPLAEGKMPDSQPRSIEELKRLLPAPSIVIAASELPQGSRRGTFETYGQVMAIWEKLHTPFIAAADALADPVQKMEGYRRAIAVDEACELAHQKLSDVARRMMRSPVNSETRIREI
ncbi:MAG TPA: hypothetical protein VH370_01795 [Humisphaera sp.]|jgi:hypothetical protein|nr:hypothetical protein [Humisphaera sp.]